MNRFLISRHFPLPLIVLISCFFVYYLFLSAIITSFRGNEKPSKTSESKAIIMYNNMNLDVSQDGHKNLVVRWAFGARDNVHNLKIPNEYIDPITYFGCMTFESKTGAACSTPYEPEIELRTDLLDFRPVLHELHTEQDERNVAFISLLSIFRGKNKFTQSQFLNIYSRIAVEAMSSAVPSNRFKIIKKPDLFGLKRIGLDHNLSVEEATSLSEIFFDGDRPETSENFSVCSDEIVPTRLQDPKSPGIPICEQYFSVPSLSAIVIIRYERQYFREWRQIKSKTIDLLTSFIQ